MPLAHGSCEPLHCNEKQGGVFMCKQVNSFGRNNKYWNFPGEKNEFNCRSNLYIYKSTEQPSILEEKKL